MSLNSPEKQGMIFISILLDAVLFGLVSQQVYRYFTSRFKDSIYLKLFVIVEFLLVGLQCLLMWHLAYRKFVLLAISPSPTPVDLWEGPVNSMCQLIIIMFANMFLAVRINSLTKSRVQSGFVVLLSVIAFIIGMFTTVASRKMSCAPPRMEWVTSVIWHTVQAVAESLITIFLVRELRNSRCGIDKSDTVVDYLARTAIQTGGLATAWAITALVTWFFLSTTQAFRIFDVTSGSVYAHAVFDTLLARVKLREQMLGETLDHRCNSQEGPKQSSKVPESPPSLAVLRVQNSVAGSLDASKPRPDHISKSDATPPEGKLESLNEVQANEA